MGYYCGLATHYPVQCPNGTFSNETGLGVESQCRPCTPGSYCNGHALLEPSGPCQRGKFVSSNKEHFHVINMMHIGFACQFYVNYATNNK